MTRIIKASAIHEVYFKQDKGGQGRVNVLDARLMDDNGKPVCSAAGTALVASAGGALLK